MGHFHSRMACSVFLRTGHRVWGSEDVPDPTTADAPDDGVQARSYSGVLQRAKPCGLFQAGPRQRGCSVLIPAARWKYFLVTLLSAQ